jgi:PAS domain S-box-containing protein
MIPTSRTASTIRRAILVFVPAALVGVAVIYLLFRAQDEAARSIDFANEEKVVEIGRQRLAFALSAVTSDLQYLAGQKALQRLLATDDTAARQELAADYLSFATHKQNYDQIRFLRLDGREVIRVNWNNGEPIVIPDEELQDKTDRSYVQETLKLDAGQIYVSPLDLNVEQGAIELPLKPMVRFGMPVFDDEGRKRGLIVLNYFGQRLLDRIAALAITGREQLWLLNAEGYWLRGPSPDVEWAFMYPDRKDRSFAQAHPEVWKAIRTGSEPGQLVIDGDLVTYARISADALPGLTSEDEPSAVQPQSWILLSYLSATVFAERTAGLSRNLTRAAVVLLLLFAGVAWVVARHWIARQQSEESLRHSEARFRNLLDSAPDAVVITDSAGRIALTNMQTEQLFGYARDELIGQSVDMLLPERYRGRHVGHRAAYVAAPRARAMGAELKLAARRRDGTEVPVAISLSPSQTAQGMMVFCDIRDITREREVEQRIEAMNERLVRDNAELDSLNKELESFSYSVSHDLRAPLRAIDGFSQALLEDYADRLDAGGRDYLERVRNAAQRMGHLIDDLLKLARVTRSEVNRDSVDMGALAREIATGLQEGAPERAAEIHIADGLQAHADARLLRIALENLLGNAWKFTAQQAPARIELGETWQDGARAFFVRDNGVGFDMAYAGRLFGAFQRLHQDGQFPGTGIGLATVQRIIRRHGGRVWAEAEAGKGATFYFTI